MPEKPIDPNNFDTSTRPQDDFYQYANGGWLERAEIPADESRWGSFDILREQNEQKLFEIFQELRGHECEVGSNAQKLRDYYHSGMDEETIESLGIGAIDEELSTVGNAQSVEDLSRLFAFLHVRGVGVGFDIDVEPDEKNSEYEILHIAQGGLGLPDRDYYTRDDEEAQKICEKYRSHITNVLVLSGEHKNEAEQKAEAIFDLERRLALASSTRTELREVENNYHKRTRQQLEELAPNFDWEGYFEEAEIPDFENLVIGQPAFFEHFSALLEDVGFEVWRAYCKFHLVESVSGKLSSDFVMEAFDFARIFSGEQELRPRYKRVISEINLLLGEALGQEFVARHFSADSKARITQMIEYLRGAYWERIEELDWMEETTKERARAKLEKLTPKIGYPEVWRDYSGLEITRDSYAGNHIRACRYEFSRKIAKIDQLIEPEEWEMSPSTVNAYFHPTRQEIVFPAGILQSPFFYAEADDAVNYGAICVVIGHEMTHGFDDQGRKFDQQGNLNDWWTPQDARNFEVRGQKLREQYDAFEILPGYFVNGSLTLGENIADLGGVVLAFRALESSLEQKGRLEKIEGFTPEERFFLALAKLWRANTRDELAKKLLVVDPHAPTRFRINGPASNMEEFYKTFGVEEGDGLYRKPEDRAKIW